MNKNLHYKISLVFLVVTLWSSNPLTAQIGGGGGCPAGTMRYYYDGDGDGFGRDNVSGCYDYWPASYVPFGGDCDDNDPDIKPNTAWYEDQDQDGFGDPSSQVNQCVKPSGNYVLNNDDQCPLEWGDTNDGCPDPEPDPDPEPEPINYNLSNENYVFSRQYRKPISNASNVDTRDQVIDEVTYLDGLGRPKQYVGIQQAGDGSYNDLVTHMEYDDFGREDKNYLPYPHNGGTVGSFKTGDVSGNTKAHYKTTYPEDFQGISESNINPYSDKHFEDSPLGRLEEVGAPGKDWRILETSDNDHTIKYEYNSNSNSEVRLYKVDLSSGTDNPSLIFSSHYDEGELYKVITRDENWKSGQSNSKDHTTEEFKDKQGQVVLKRAYEDNDPHDTYYVYDDYGNLTFVLPPKTNSTIGAPTASELNKLCYQYKYDGLNRMIEKKLPGKGWEYMVYNKLDQMVLTQDALQQQNDEWLFTKYDALGRVAYTGLFESTSHDRESLQNLIDNTSNYEEYVERKASGSSYAGTTVYYTNSTIPTGMEEIYTVNYYDSYSNLNIGFSIPNINSLGVPIEKGLNTKGLQTLSKVRVLETNDWITTAIGYDEKGREIWRKTENTYLDTKETVEHELDFIGNIQRTRITHEKDGQAPIVIVDNYEYDHVNRLTEHTQTIDGDTELIAENTYNALGELITKGVGNTPGNPLQDIVYDYNVRGWLKEINDIENTNKLFNFKLFYNDPTSGDELYNGNISQTKWRTNNDDSSLKTYTYDYDALNRLTAADFIINTYDLSGVSYDKNGNITSLQRDRYSGGDDSFVYNYDGNQLLSMTGTKPTTFDYDLNGNLTSDANKGITNITYNHLNLPELVTIGGQIIDYTYDATGVKLKKEIPGKITEYAGNFVYEDLSGTMELQFFSTPEGYVSYDSGQFNYVYNYLDHLGNVRLSYTDGDGNGSIDPATEIIQEKNYYPFGLTHQGYNGGGSAYGNAAAKRYGFGGKELQSESISGNILDWYDVSARNYDPALGRWFNPDPLSDEFPEWSPYSYVYNNPLNNTDSTGMCPDGDCPDPPTTVDGGELDEVVIVAYTKNRTWTSETGDWNYNGIPKQYQQEYPEFAGMNDAQMQTHWSNNYSSGYRQWTQANEGQMRLGAFINRFKSITYDTGALQGAEEVLQWSIGGASAPFVGRGVMSAAPKVMNSVKTVNSLYNEASIYSHVVGNAKFNQFKRMSMDYLSKPISRSNLGFSGQKTLMRYGSEQVNYLKRLYNYEHNIMNTGTLDNALKVKDVISDGAKFFK